MTLTHDQRWRDSAAQDATGEKAFAAVLGKTPGDANDTWTKWVKGL